jgi:hypothetical protein
MAKVMDGMKPPLMIPVGEDRGLNPPPMVPVQPRKPPTPAQPAKTDKK